MAAGKQGRGDASGKSSFVPEDYVPVSDRIAVFWRDHPAGAITTNIQVERDELNGPIAWTAYTRVWREKPNPLPADAVPDADGWARQVKLAVPPKKRDGADNVFAPEWTSPMEVAETSAIGRALANLGYATKDKPRASRDEVQRAQATGQADPHELAWAKTVEACANTGLSLRDAESMFVESLRVAKVRAGGRIETEEQYHAVLAEVDAAIRVAETRTSMSQALRRDE